ncbi:hypothetical protein KIN20_017790 [Parelaphostrongylus tenuis]|uniref:Uncharacterized protein n=1 Tax=Parelaphostrongylus tenuis TaxID=148309 RepID=A0AAD5QRR2_PARTN|nr:hypothetical protein KIN20_017790 [Parelaphostrongylus tenuis]
MCPYPIQLSSSIATTSDGVKSFVSRLVMQTITDVLEQRGRSAAFLMLKSQAFGVTSWFRSVMILSNTRQLLLIHQQMCLITLNNFSIICLLEKLACLRMVKELVIYHKWVIAFYYPFTLVIEHYKAYNWS